MLREHRITKVDAIPFESTGSSKLRFLTSPDEAGLKSMAVMQGILEPRRAVPLHSHADPECFYLLAGTMEVYQDVRQPAGWTVVQAGEFAVTYPHAKHAWRNRGSEACVCLIVTGAEVFRFLTEACRLQAEMAAGSTSNEAIHAELAQLAAETHCWLASPQENAALNT